VRAGQVGFSNPIGAPGAVGHEFGRCGSLKNGSFIKVPASTRHFSQLIRLSSSKYYGALHRSGMSFVPS